MDQAFSQREDTQQQQQQLFFESKYCICIPLLKFSVFAYWVSKSRRSFSQNRVFYGYHRFRSIGFTGMVVNNSVFCALSGLGGELKDKMVENGDIEEENLGVSLIRDGETYRLGDLVCESISSSDFVTSDATVHEEHSFSSFEDSASSSELEHTVDYARQVDAESEEKHNGKLGSSVSEIEMMKERFSKLLLGEDMSGCGNGVCTALAISNAITNLCATIFGQLWKLEPMSPEKKAMWQREMDWLLCVSDQIVELTPTWQIFPDGSKLEVMTCRPRSDLYINLPALRKLDNMLLEILDNFNDNEFWYVDQGVMAPDNDGSTSLRKALQRQEEKWWLPMPTVSPGGLTESSRKKLQHKRDSTNQILKAAMAINTVILADMEVPDSYLEALPKNGKANLGVIIYRYISSEQFSAECLLDCLDLSSEHQAIEIANRVEASMFVWRRRGNSKPSNNVLRSSSISSWGLVKEMMIDVDKMELLAERAESLLLCLKQRFPCLPQTALDMSKIQYNKDVGKSILESYSRVLESLAFNIIARIDDLLYVDEFTKQTDKLPSLASVGLISHRSVTIPHVPVPSTPYKTEYATPTFSPSQSASPAKGDRNRFLTIGSSGLTVKKVLMDYLSVESKGRDYCNLSERVGKTTRSLTLSSTENSIVEN